jgi:hypothetical protein
MKKVSLMLTMAAFAINFLYAQTNTFPSSGNVGIGTTSPTSLLSLNGALEFSNLNAAPAGSGIYLGLNFLQVRSGSGGFTVNNNANTAANLTVLNGGNVGIGNINPSEMLDVGSKSNAVANYVRINGLTGTPNTELGGIKFYNAVSTGFEIARIAVGMGTTYVDDGYLTFSVGNTGTFPEAMRITQGGNVGVGTTTPDQLLSVNGTIHSKEVLVNTAGFPDYVFKPAYHLPTLVEVKTYIDQNHHLPDMPAEAEVIKNGLKVGETEGLLTKKVEELTLYLIEKDRQVEDLHATNQNLQKQLTDQQKEIGELKKMIIKN